MTAIIESILTALAATAMKSAVEAIAAIVAGWYIKRQKQEVLSQIADAAALSARAQTAEDRYVAAEAWRKALSRPRINP